MPRPRLRAFEPDDVIAAGALLAERHRRHRVAQPLLAARYEEAAEAAAAVQAAYDEPHASGAVALLGDEVVGYLLGAPKANPTWGPNIWVEAAGLAATDGEVMRDLYGLAATQWVNDGRTAHYVLVPATDPELVRAWFRLGFGQQHAHAIRMPRRLEISSQVTVRPALRSDIPVLAQLDLELPLHQGRAPTFSAGRTGTYEENVADWEADFDDPGYAVFVAEVAGAVVGSAVGTTIEKSTSHIGPARPERAGFLGFACVLPEARGAGAGRALGAAVLGWAEAHFDSIVTDWRVTNLTSSRAWPALGFTETFLRLHRNVGY